MAPALPATDDGSTYASNGAPRMTVEVLQEICKERNMWRQPHLNTQVFLNYKGFDGIEGLEEWVNVRVLQLDNNNIKHIEGLDRMTDLRSLQLGFNRITEIQGLQCNVELRHLNLEGNGVKCIPNLRHLNKLEVLNLSANSIEHLEDMQELCAVPSLINIDVSQNKIESSDGVLEFWTNLADHVKVLRYHGNPGIRNIAHYRKRLVNAMPLLSYLDERPVFPVERKSCAAWAVGGNEAMHKAKQDHHRARNAECCVDPERRELITRMRKLAIDRLDREAMLKKEASGAAAPVNTEPGTANNTATGGALQEGDLDALGEYEKSWRRKVNLYGVDGVRAKEAAGTDLGVQRAMGFQKNSTNPSSAPSRSLASEQHTMERAPVHDFAPPARELAAPGAPASPQRDAAQRTREPGRWATSAADFRQRGYDINSDRGEDDRQVRAMGEDPWAGTGMGNSLGKQGTLAARAGAEVVVPQCWEARAATAASEEAEVFARNMENMEASSVCAGDTASAAARGIGNAIANNGNGRNELQVLD